MKKTKPPLPKKPVKKVDPLLARIADLETMNDTLFKRTSDLAQHVVTLVDNITALHESVAAINALLEITD